MDDSNFFSIDRLVEFGMGMAMAQQMVGVMNQTMRQMYVPGSPNSIPQPQPVSIFVALEGQTVGPITEADFSQMISLGKITKDTLVWTPGMLNWLPLEQVPNLLRIVALTPPPLPLK